MDLDQNNEKLLEWKGRDHKKQVTKQYVQKKKQYVQCMV